MKKLLLVLPITTVLLLGACGETSSDEKEKENDTIPDSSITAEDLKAAGINEDTGDLEEDEDEIFSIGDTILIDDVEITITKAKFTPPAEYSESEKGKILTIDITVKNTSNEQIYISDSDFGLSMGDEQAEDYFGYDQFALSAKLNKGKQTTGKLYFDVKDSDTYELIYAPFSAFDDQEVKWEIKVR